MGIADVSSVAYSIVKEHFVIKYGGAAQNALKWRNSTMTKPQCQTNDQVPMTN
jgi:hypothetical protein